MWISYQSPAFAALLFAVPVFVLLFLWLGRHQRRALQEFFQDRPIDETTGQLRSDLSNALRSVFLILAYALGTLALMDPVLHTVSEQPINQTMPTTAKIRRKIHDVVFLLDVSASMGVKDGRLSRSRLDYAKELIDEIISQLHGETISLYTFTSKLVQVVPGTMDYLYLRSLLKDVEVNSTGVTGTVFSVALKGIYQKFWEHPTQRKVTVIILSDGGDTTLEDTSGIQRQKKIDQITSELHRHGVVDTIGLGTVAGGDVPGITQKVHSSLDENLLQAISTAGRGQYFRASDLSSADLAQQVVASLRAKPSYGGALITGPALETETKRHSLFQLFLGLAMLFLSLALLWPGSIGLALALVAFTWPLGLQAADEATLERASRRGALYIQVNDLERARSVYQGILTEDLAGWQRDILQYDLGTLSLVQQQWTQALEWFEKVEKPEELGEVFLYRWRFNRALALYGEASSNTLMDDDDRTFLLEELLAITEKSTQIPMKSLRTAAKQLLSEVQARQTAAFLTKESPLQGVAVVWAWAVDLKRQMEKIPPTSDEANVKQWLLSYGDEGEKLKQFWRENTPSKRLLEGLLTQLRYGAIPPVQLPLDQFIASASSAMGTTESPSGRLQQTLLEALAIRPLALDAVQKMQGEMKAEDSPDLLLEQANANAAFTTKDARLAAIYAQQALFWLQEFLQKDQATPKEILKRAVRIENQAWRFTGNAIKYKELQTGVIPFQQQVLTSIAPFIPRVLEQQRASYLAQKCQNPLWQAVLPLFFQGEAPAKEAIQDKSSLTSVLQQQKEAYRKWSKALEMLVKEQPRPERSAESTVVHKELPKQIKDLSVQDALRLLQSMQEADRREVQSSPVKQGPKPW